MKLNCCDWSDNVQFKKKNDTWPQHDRFYMCKLYQKTKLNNHDRSGKVQSMMKVTQDNDGTDHTSMVYTENETKLLWLIRQGRIYDESDT